MGEKFNGYKTGRFEAMQSTRNALTGDKRRIDLLSRMKANPKEKPLVFNGQDQDTIDQVKSAEANRDRRQLDKLIKTHNELSQKYMLDTILADRAMEMAPKIWEAVDHRLNQEAQKKIQEKIETRVAAAKAKKEQEKQEKPLSEFEMTMMVWKLLAEAQNKALKKTAEEVALFIIDRLPGPVYRALSVLGVISLVLAACASFTPNPEFNPAGDNNTPSGEMTDLPEETSEPTEEATVGPKIEATSTVTADQLTGLNSDIDQKTVEAQEQAQETDLMAWANNQALRSAESRTPIFSAALTSPENPEDAVLDPGSFDMVVLPSGRVAAIINVDSVWGPAGTVAVIDTGESQGMFATEEGAIRSALGITSDTEVKVALEKYEVLFEKTEDVGIDQSLYYAILREKGPNGKIIKVIDATRRWVDLKDAKPLQNAGVTELLRALENGEIENLDGLSEEGLIQLSEALTNQLNSARDKNPAIYNGEAVIDPETGKLLNYDGSPDKSEVIEMYWSYAGRDEQGNVKMRNGEEVITIQNSAGIENWEEIYTDPKDPRIKWPTNIANGQTASPAQILMGPDRPNPVVLRVVVPIGETIGEVFVEGYGKASGIRLMILEDDGSGNILFGKELIGVGSPAIRLYESGKSTESVTAGAVIDDYSDFWKNLEQYAAHYMAIPKDQSSVYNRGYNGSLEKYSGLIHGQEAFDVISGENSNDKDILLLAIAYLMKR